MDCTGCHTTATIGVAVVRAAHQCQMAEAPASWSVVRTQDSKGRYVYTVNGVAMKTAKAKYALALVGTGNPYRNGENGEPSDGFYLNLSNSFAVVRRTLAQFPQMVLAEIEEG